MKRIFFAAIMVLSLASCTKEGYFEDLVDKLTQKNKYEVTLVNPSFEEELNGWKSELPFDQVWDFSQVETGAHSGTHSLLVYYSFHYDGDAPTIETQKGKVFQTISSLKDGRYYLQVWVKGNGKGVYLYANGGGTDVTKQVSGTESHIESLEFNVLGGQAQVGVYCAALDNSEDYIYSEYLFDDFQLWRIR